MGHISYCARCPFHKLNHPTISKYSTKPQPYHNPVHYSHIQLILLHCSRIICTYLRCTYVCVVKAESFYLHIHHSV